MSKQRVTSAFTLLCLAGNTCGFLSRPCKRSRQSNVFYRRDVDSYSFSDPVDTKQIQYRDSVVLPGGGGRGRGRGGAPLPPTPPLPQIPLPTWLTVSRGHLLGNTLARLRETMLESFFTESEALKLQFAIEEAALGDAQKMAGAAELCVIMVETMEMGLTSLIAAAFHYCSCAVAREDQSLGVSSQWEYKHNVGLPMFGSAAVDIEQDAFRLKQIEMVYANVMRAKSDHVCLNSKDADNLKKLLLSESKEWRALAIRSAACLYRLRGLERAGVTPLTPEAVKASREALYIFAPLASRLGMQRLKNELEDAAFRILYRRQYTTVTSLTAKSRRYAATQDQKALSIGDCLNSVMENVVSDMERVLRSDPVFSSVIRDFTVTARVKEPFSMWRKMLRYGSRRVLEVPDAIAFRIVLNAKKVVPDESHRITSARERALCYYTRQLCTYNWAPLELNPRFKDYIDNPKDNGYQSLHYTGSTTWNGEPWTMEVQIRSGEMHDVAEYGLASHWDYKSKPKSSSQASDDRAATGCARADKSPQEWQGAMSNAIEWEEIRLEPEILVGSLEAKVRAERIRSRGQHLAPYIQALTSTRSHLSRDSVFVFLSQSSSNDGRIVSLPAGSCVADALKEGDFHGKALHNGATANAREKLRNGDVISLFEETSAPRDFPALP